MITRRTLPRAGGATWTGRVETPTSSGAGPALNQGIDRMRRLVCEYYEGFSFGNFVRQNPDLRGKITDLLIGDLFTDKVDVVWEPMEALYKEGKEKPISWVEGQSQDEAVQKTNELLLPVGAKP